MIRSYILFAAIVFLLNIQEVHAQWIDKSPSGFVSGTFINMCQVESSPIMWAVGNNGAVIKSINSGVSWENIQLGITNNLQSVFFIDSLHGWIVGGRILWSTKDSAIVLATTDGGITWKKQYNSYDSYNDVWFTDKNNGWVVGALNEIENKGVILRTSDGGNHWNRFTINGKISKIKFYNSQLGFICRTSYGEGYAGTIEKTTNGGNNWSKITFNYSDGDNFTTILDIAWQDTNHVMCINGNQAYYSSDGGNNWQPTLVRNPAGYKFNRITSVGNATWIATTNKTILKTTNNGSQWDTLLINASISITDLYFSNSQNGIVLTREGNTFLTSNGGLTWSINRSGIQALNTIEIISPSHIIVGGNNGLLLESTSGGDSWKLLNIGTQANINQIEFANDQIGWASTSDGFYKTNNSGESWNKFTNEVFNTFFVSDHSHIFAGSSKTYNGVHGFQYSHALLKHSADGGQTWQMYEHNESNQLPNSLFFWDSTRGIASLGRSSNAIILSTFNGGKTWNQISPTFNGYLFTLTMVKDSLGWGLNLIDVSNNNYSRTVIVKTTDGGYSWNPIKQSESKISSIFFGDTYHGWACGDGGVIFQTTDGGTKWDSIKTTSDKSLYMIKFVENIGYAIGADGTVLKTTNGGVLFSDQEISNTPNQYNIFQNYPNPFNPKTTIEFDIPQHNFVSLKVYDILGNEVETLVNEFKSASSYKIEFDGSSLSSGVYFYKLEAGEFVETKKLILMK